MKRALLLPVMALALNACSHVGTHVCQDGACHPSPKAEAAISAEPQT